MSGKAKKLDRKISSRDRSLDKKLSDLILQDIYILRALLRHLLTNGEEGFNPVQPGRKCNLISLGFQRPPHHWTVSKFRHRALSVRDNIFLFVKQAERSGTLLL